MGANMSTVEENTTSVSPASATIETLPTTNYYSYNKPYANYNYNYHNSSAYHDNRYALHESRVPPTSLAPPPKAANPRIMAFHSPASWKAYLEASKAFTNLIVIDFSTGWCRPCRHMEPTLNEFAAKYTDVEFVKIDADELFDVSRQYGIQTMPTFVFVKKGKQIDKVIGARREELQRKIEKHRV